MKVWLPILTAILGLIAGLMGIRTATVAGIGFDQILDAVSKVGFPIVIAIALLVLLGYVIFDAVAHFNNRLDVASQEQNVGFREMANVIRHLDMTLDRLGDQASANHEALSNLMLFVSHTQQEVVAHRKAIEENNPTPIPSIPIKPPDPKEL